jgi:hypothetical protein
MTGTFSALARAYRKAGFWPRPITPGSKACHIRDWQRPDPEIPSQELRDWLRSHADHGIGLLMGSPLPDGTTLGALDIDHDDFINLGAVLLRAPVCARVGSKGIVFFVRVRGSLGNPPFCVKGEVGTGYGKVAECLFDRKLCVIPPTIHPNTGLSYDWRGKFLLETNFSELPVIEA